MENTVQRAITYDLYQVNSDGLHEDQTRNFQVKERENNCDAAVNCQVHVLLLGNEIWSNGVVTQRKTHVITTKPAHDTLSSTNPTWISSLGLNLDPCDYGMSNNL